MYKKDDLHKHFWTPARIGLTVFVLSLVAAFGVSSCNSSERTAGPAGTASNTSADKSGASDSKAPPSRAALATLPSNVLESELKAVNGAPIKLSDYSGKVLLVNLWATWCGPCRLEVPELVKLHKEYRSQGLEMVGLSTENPISSAESVREFVHDFNVDYRIGWATSDVALTLMQGQDNIPQSFLISRDGRILKRFIGFSPINTPPLLKRAIEEALNDKGKA
jgi:glutathione peroxidase-family protein